MSDTPNLRMLGESDPDLEAAVPESFQVVDSTPEVTPATFDSSAFLAGIRPTRRSVRIVERADLVGDMERLAQMYNEADAEDDDAECERLAAEFQPVADAFHDSKRWYTVEKRSSEWIEHFREETAETLGLDLESDDKAVRRELLIRQVAEQIVAPEGTTYDDLLSLYERNEGELNKLVVATTMANQQTADSAKVATPGFSLRRSEKTTAPGSTKR